MKRFLLLAVMLVVAACATDPGTRHDQKQAGAVVAGAVIGGLIVLLLPLSRVVPPLYTYRVRQRVFRWYARLRQIESRIEEGGGERTEMLNELDELDRVASHIAVPLAHADELYALRGHIHATRKRLLSKPAESE